MITMNSSRTRRAPLAVVMNALPVGQDPTFIGPMKPTPSPELNKSKVSKGAKSKAPASKPKSATPAASKATGAAGSALVTFKKLPKDGEKLAPQALAILKVLQKAPKGLTVHQLVTEKLNATILATVQPPARIWTFYRKTLVEGKFVGVK